MAPLTSPVRAPIRTNSLVRSSIAPKFSHASQSRDCKLRLAKPHPSAPSRSFLAPRPIRPEHGNAHAQAPSLFSPLQWFLGDPVPPWRRGWVPAAANGVPGESWGVEGACQPVVQVSFLRVCRATWSSWRQSLQRSLMRRSSWWEGIAKRRRSCKVTGEWEPESRRDPGKGAWRVGLEEEGICILPDRPKVSGGLFSAAPWPLRSLNPPNGAQLPPVSPPVLLWRGAARRW